MLRTQLPLFFSVIARHLHNPEHLKYSNIESRKITLIRLAQATLVDDYKFSEYEAFNNFNSISKANELVRDYADFSNKLKQEFDDNLGLTQEIYDNIKSTKLTKDYISKISQQFQNQVSL